MKHFYFLIFLILFSPLALSASPIGVVERQQGQISYQEKELQLNSQIQGKGVLKSGPRSFVKIKVEQWGSSIILGPDSEMSIDLISKEATKVYLLEKGYVRWRTYNQKKLEEVRGISTKTAAMGVRGTDFLVIANELLNETEIVVFDGVVELKNLKDPTNSFEVSKGQWGGLGGRFTQKIQPPITLPANVFQKFSRRLEL